MSTSGTVAWTLKRDAIINAALRKISVLSGGSSPETFEVTNAAEALNAMCKGFAADGMPIWAIRSYSFTPTINLATYTIGTGQTLDTLVPLKIIQAERISTSGAANVPMNVMNNYDYNLLPVNASAATPVTLYYQPLTSSGVINLWPKPDNSTTTITIHYQRPFEDINNNTDDIDVPPYWMEALIYGLAWRLSPEYGTPIQDRAVLAKEAEYFHQQALSFGTEEGSLLLMPDWAGRH